MNDLLRLFTHLMSRKQKVELAIYSARLVLPIFEEKYPADDRLRKAIEAAENCLKAKSAADEVYATAAAAYAATDAAAAFAAADDAAVAFAAACAYDAAYAAAYAGDTYAAADANSARREIQEKIIRKSVEILA